MGIFPIAGKSEKISIFGNVLVEYVLFFMVLNHQVVGDAPFLPARHCLSFI